MFRFRTTTVFGLSATSSLSSSFRFSSSSSSTSTSSFKSKFWAPVNEQKQRTGLENVKEAAQKFQMIGHVQKLMVLPSSSSISSVNKTNDETNESNDDNNYIFSWSGVQTNHPQVVEDFLIFLSCGFDIKSVDCENDILVLEHARNFLGWKPAPNVIAASETETEAAAAAVNSSNPNTLRLPFTMNFELQEVVPSLSRNTAAQDDAVVETETKFSRVTFDCPFIDTLRNNTKCPPEILACLQDGGREPVKMVVALRKAGVRPEIISWRALKSATKKTNTWASALGVL